MKDMIALEPGLAVSTNHIVWVKIESDQSIKLYLDAPGPNGKTEYHARESVAVSNINKWLERDDS